MLAIAVMFMYKRLCEMKFCIFVILFFSRYHNKIFREKKSYFSLQRFVSVFEAEVDRVQAHIGFESYPDREIDGYVLRTAGFHQWCYYANFCLCLL